MDKIIQKKKKMFAYIFLFIILFSFLGNTCKAEINTDYGNNGEVNTVDLDKKVENSALWEAIAQLIYGVGNVIENLVGTAMSMLTGSGAFPWADRIIFNTMPMLDINFINPSSGSMFKSSTNQEQILSKIIKNIYYTVLSLAVGFLGVAVGIMAVRLAISTIASEKARYKEAIMNWLLGIVMLFTMHFILSFVFYTNEQMVKIASNILKDSIEDVELPVMDTYGNSKIMVSNFLKKQYDAANSVGWNMGGHASNYTPGSHADLTFSYQVTFEHLITDILGGHIPTEEDVLVGDTSIKFFSDNGVYKRNLVIISKLLNDPEYRRIQLFYASGSDTDNWAWWNNFWMDNDNAEGAIRTIYNDMCLINADGKMPDLPPDGIFNNDHQDDDEKEKQKKVYEIMNKICNETPMVIDNDFSEDGTSATQIISNMAEYFKETSWTYETDDSGNVKGWTRNQITIVGATLYAIFVIQSLMYFIQYIKRFFYIIILSLIGPAVVIYDFVTKSIK